MRIKFLEDKVDKYVLLELDNKPGEYGTLVNELSMNSEDVQLSRRDKYGRDVDRFIIYSGIQVDLITYRRNFYLEVRRTRRDVILKNLLKPWYIKDFFFLSPFIIKIIKKYGGGGLHIPIRGNYPPSTLDDKIQES